MFRLKIIDLRRAFTCRVGHKNIDLKYKVKHLPSEVRENTYLRFLNCGSKQITNKAILCATIFSLIGLEKEEAKESDLITTIKRSVLLIQRDELVKAEQMLHLALRIAQQTQNELGITYIYDVMANLALQRGELKKAEKLFVTVMQRLIADGSAQESIKNIHISIKLARIYHLNGDKEKSALGFKWAIENLEKATESQASQDHLMLLIQAKDWYARLLMDEKKYTEALKCLEESCNNVNQLEEKDAEHIIMLLNDMATISEILEDYSKSEDYLVQAIELSKDVPDIYDIGTIHVNLGRINMRKGLYDKARKNCGLGLKLGHQRKNKETMEQANSCLKQVNKLS